MTKGPIAVVGATGYTGGRVLASLARRGVSVRLVGRNLERLTRAAGGLEGAEPRASLSLEDVPRRLLHVLDERDRGDRHRNDREHDRRLRVSGEHQRHDERGQHSQPRQQ